MNLRVDQAQFWHSDRSPGLELMRAHWVHHSFPKHFHDSYTIGINDGGAGHFQCRRKNQEAWPDTLNVIEPGDIHTGGASTGSGWIYRDFYISFERMRELARQANLDTVPEFRSATIDDPQLADQFRRAFEAMSGTPTAHLEQDYLLLKAIRRLCVRHAERRGPESTKRGKECLAISRIREYLHTYYVDEITTSRLADLVQWSPYHLIRAFHAQIGMPPHAYQNALRVNEAQKQLRAGANIADAAQACGFYDQSHMNRLFRRMLGTTPGAYLQQRAIPSKT
jgi:AraC-like DNA-binding protein